MNVRGRQAGWMAGLLTSHPNTCTRYVTRPPLFLSTSARIQSIYAWVCVYVFIGYEFRSILPFYPVCLHYQQVQKTGSCCVITTVSEVSVFPTTTSMANAHAWWFSSFPLENVSRMSFTLSRSFSLWGVNHPKRERAQSYKWKRDWNCLRIRFSLLLALIHGRKKKYFPFFSRLAEWFTTMPWMIQIHRLIERENNNKHGAHTHSLA